VIGLVAGVIVVLAVVGFDKVKIDDPVGALSVHLVCGIWGTLALGLFYDNEVATNIAALATGLTRGAQTLAQLQGVLAVGAFTFSVSIVLWYAVKLLMGVRVSPEEEIEGLDIGEHGNHAYPDFATHGSSYSAAAPAAAAMAPALASQKPAVAKS
jgi:Amt family ammonium transporter